MENQHRKIKGYRELNEQEIANMNKVKLLAADVGNLVEALYKNPDADLRWVDIAASQLQLGFMALTRSIAKPEFF